MSNSANLREEIFAAGEAAEDRGWPMPLGDQISLTLAGSNDHTLVDLLL